MENVNIYQDEISKGWIVEVRGPSGWRASGQYDSGWYVWNVFGTKKAAVEAIKKDLNR